MPRIIIKKDDLPPISADDEGYNIKLRLISQDRNRTSYWTPILQVEAPQVTEIPYVFNVSNFTSPSGNQKTVTVVWNDPNNNKQYDVYVKWYASAGDPNAQWEYAGSTFANTYSLISPTAHSFQVAVQRLTYPKEYVQRYALFTSAVHNL